MFLQEEREIAMASGIAIDAECSGLYEKFQTGEKAFRCISFRVSPDMKTVIPDEKDWQIRKEVRVNAREDTKNALTVLCNQLVTGNDESIAQPRWILFNFEFETAVDKRPTDKSIFIKWCPETSTIKNRMVFTTSTKGLIDHLNLSATNVQADSIDEIKEILGKLESGNLK
eukprot:sb/3472175/